MSFPRDTVAELVAQLAGVECVWSDLKTPQVGASGKARGRAWVELSYGADVPKGDGEYRQWPSKANPDVLESRVVLTSLVTISMHAKSYEPERQALDILKAVRWKLRTTTSAVVYASCNIAMVRTHPIAPFRGTGVGMTVRLDATMDVVFAMLDGGDPGDDPGTTIGQANGGGVIPFTAS